MSDYIIAMLVVPILLISWLLVQQYARRFAKRHPEFGAFREGGGCGSNCGCGKVNSCKNKNQS